MQYELKRRHYVIYQQPGRSLKDIYKSVSRMHMVVKATWRISTCQYAVVLVVPLNDLHNNGL